MPTQLLFYADAVPISSQRHRDLSVKMGTDYSFARSANAVPLTGVEFARAAREYAVVFAGQGEITVPVAVLGAQADQNLFVADDGRWDARYVPAFVRRYPFVFSSADDGRTFTLCIDESFSGCNREGRGERLFDADGERTQYLETVLAFVREYQAHFQRTLALGARLKELELLDPMQAEFTRADGQRGSLTGFMAVNRNKLYALEDQVLAAMLRSGEMELIHLHLQSMQNFGTMLTRIGATPRPAADAVEAEAETVTQDDEADTSTAT